MIPGVGQKYGSAFTAMPLSFVVAVSMIKDKIEDNKRRLQDDAENNMLVWATEHGTTTFK